MGLSGEPARWHAEHPAPNEPAGLGLLGVDVSPTEVEGRPQTVVQLLFDDDQVGFDRTLLDGPMVAELHRDDGGIAAREPFDHDRFRRVLHAEREAGESITRGVLVLSGGELPPPWVRMAFVPMDIADTAGATLVIRRTSTAEMLAGVERAHAEGAVSDEERRALLTSIDQLHPADPEP